MVLSQELKKTVRILVPLVWTTDQKGNFLEDVASTLLKRQRYKIIERVRFTGMEIDLVADHIDTHQRAFVECKFVREPFSANVIDLLRGKALRKKVNLAYLFSTAPPGKEAKGVIDELQRDQSDDSPKLAFVGPDQIAEMFADIYGAEPVLPRGHKGASIALATLIITPELPSFWLLEEHSDGIPQRVFIQPVSDEPMVSVERFVEVLREHQVCEGLELVFETSSASRLVPSERLQPKEEVITSVAVADSLEDYRPCKPQDFVGRYDMQKKVWDFLRRVREDVTGTRILALSGPSGFGKSSVVLKLSDRFRNKKWSNKFYLFPVDVRSARGPLFVAKALKIALEKAIDDGFIPVDEDTITIESIDSLLQGTSVQAALDALQASRRVLIIFFDQFEELFTKDELLSTFEAFRRLAFEVHSARANLVVGFSWRTGITLSDDNPAYHVWHGLKDLRVDVSAESSELVGQFERELSKRLLPPLRRRLLEQGQGLPWLLKKLCIHVYREIRSGTHQEELLSRRLNVRSLFDEDLQPLAEQQTKCLRYIATNSPADMLKVLDYFDQETVNQLYSNRLIVRAGQKYAVYWDIFRNYLVEGTVPAIPWTYVPTVSFSIALRAFLLLRQEGSSSLSNFAKKLGYAESTTGNIVGDLRNFLFASRDLEGRYSVRGDLVAADNERVAEFVKNQLQEHVVMQNIYDRLVPGQTMTMEEFKHTIRVSYSAANLGPGTVNVYSNRLLPWFKFAGLLESSEDRITRPREHGSDFGKLISVRDRYGKTGGTFMCSASPQRVVNLAQKLISEGSLPGNDVLKEGNRNAASDLVNLGFAVWQAKFLVVAENAFTEPSRVSLDNIFEIVGARALDSRFLQELGVLLKRYPGQSSLEIGRKLAGRLRRNWSDTSTLRYIRAGRRWLHFFSSPRLKLW
jgi:Holliday junction resolvase-like predicted endonuclease